MKVFSLNVQSTNRIAVFENVIDTIGRFQTLWSLAVLVILLIAFLGCVFAFRRKINQASKTQIKKFEDDGKYLPPVYVELHREKESLRYFIFSRRWKYRIVKQYNHLFEGYEGTRLKEILPSNMQFRLSPFCSFSEINCVLNHMCTSLENFRKEEEKYYQKFGQVVWAIRNSTYYYVGAIRYLQDLMSMISEKNVILVGSAGNGKTSLLCRMSEIIIANKMPCILINARDIKEDCTSYVMGKLPLSRIRDGKMGKWLLRLVSILLFLGRKHFYILIDAVNENDREIFTDSIGELMDSFAPYKRIRILFTCRSEYFDSRYKLLFASAHEKPYVFQLNAGDYDDRAMRKMISAYREYYHVSGPIPYEMSEKLMNSLLLTRLFFEVNSNRDECTLEFQNAEIYKLYFDRIAAANGKLDLKSIVNKIAELMVANCNFETVPMKELNLSSDDLDSFRKLLDNNLMISHSVHAGSGITETNEEHVYFVFDELRDFCLARYLLMLDESNADQNYTAFFAQANLLFTQRLSPIEGIIKYAYHHFRETAQYGLCQKLLSDFGEVDVPSTHNFRASAYHPHKTFSNYGFSLIFAEGNSIIPFEKDYIIRCIERNYRHYWDIFWYLLKNEYTGHKPDIDLAVSILVHWQDYNIFQKILGFFFANRYDVPFPYQNKSRRVDILEDWVKHIEAKNGKLSESLKAMLVILSAYRPLESALNDYHKFILDEPIFQRLSAQIKCEELLASIQELKERAAPPKGEDLDFLQVLLMSDMEGKDE